MGITSFTLSGLGAVTAVVRCRVKRTMPPHVGQYTIGPGHRGEGSWLSWRDNQLLPDEELIAVGQRIQFENRVLRDAESRGNA